MPAKYVHISYLKRWHQGHFDGGGVGKFAWFLQQVVPEFEIFSLQDYPNANKLAGLKEWVLAEKLNEWLLETGQLDRDSTVVVDGWWGNGLYGKVKRLIITCHGSYIATCLAAEQYPWDDTSLGEYAMEQIKHYQQSEVVAVSAQAARELKLLCSLDAMVIPNCVPHDKYRPDPSRCEPDVILHVASRGRKNLEMVDQLIATSKYRIQKLGFPKSGTIEEEALLWQRGGILLMPSLYEGSSYALLEALACGLVPVVYPTGDAVDLPCDAAIVNDDNHLNAWCHALDLALTTRESLFPRQWSEQNRDFSVFAEGWKNYLNL